MKILVPIKWCVDYRVRVHPSQDGKELPTHTLKKAINPFDEIAIEQAIKWQEASSDTDITLLSIGVPDVCDGLRYGLAMGANQAIWLETQHAITPLQTAQYLAEHVTQNPYDMVLMGKQAIDTDHHQTGQMLASLLDWPQATCASEIVCTTSSAQITQEVDGGLATVTCDFPCVITTDLRLNTPRYPTLPQLMMANQKPLHHHTLPSVTTPANNTCHYATTQHTRQPKTYTCFESLISQLKQEGAL